MARDAKILVLVALGVALAFFGFMLQATDAHFVPQVVDLYLVCQYARAMAEGHPFQYNPGEPASTGATSLLHTTVLAAAHAVGVRGEGLIAFAVLGGAALFVASVLLARRAALHLGQPRAGLLAGLLVALGGPVVWGFLYGSDIAVFMFLSLWIFERLAGGKSAVVPATLLALARPEGLPIALGLAAVWLVVGPCPRRFWLPGAAGVAVLALYRALTGQWLGTSVADKSLFANYGLREGLAVLSEYVVDVVRGLLLGFYPSQASVGFARGWASLYFPPLGLLLVLLALARVKGPTASAVRAWAAILAAVTLLVAPNVFVGVHFNRYVLWTLPCLLVLAARGLAELDPALFHAGAVLLVALGSLSTARFATMYGEMAGEVYQRDVKAAEWIRRNLPAGVAMLDVATSVEYLTGHRNLNLHGVTTPAFFGNTKAEREAGVFESLGRLPASERPPYLITSDAAQEASPSLREIVTGEAVYGTTGTDSLLIYRTRWDLVGRNGQLFMPETQAAVAGRVEVDRLNVCDSRDEAAHGYRVQSRLGALRLDGSARIAAYPPPVGATVVDGGRVILGSETFSVRTGNGKDLVMVLRTASEAAGHQLRADGMSSPSFQLAEEALTVEVDGRSVVRASLRPRPGWDEWVVVIPASALAPGATRLELRGRYAAFYYWFYQ